MCASAKNSENTTMETLIASLIALALFIYLLVAMIRPEKI